MNFPDPKPFHESMESFLANIIQSFLNSMKQHGLSTPQIHALMYIFHADECQVSDIGTLADVSNAAASQLVERLVQQDLVDRREDPENRRNKLVTLSKKGKDLIHNSVISNPFLMKIIATLTLEQLQVIHNAFTILAQTGQQIQSIQGIKDSQQHQIHDSMTKSQE
jgi:DNA-binding MarR family transcriptional regulator